MQINNNTVGKFGFKASFANDKETVDIIKEIGRTYPEYTMATDLALKSIKSDDKISLGYDEAKFYAKNTLTGKIRVLDCCDNKYGAIVQLFDDVMKGKILGKNRLPELEKKDYLRIATEKLNKALKEDNEIINLWRERVKLLESQLNKAEMMLFQRESLRDSKAIDTVSKQVFKTIKRVV